MIRSSVRYLPGLALVGVAGVLYSRAGYAPFGDAQQRVKPCAFTRCANDASLVLDRDSRPPAESRPRPYRHCSSRLVSQYRCSSCSRRKTRLRRRPRAARWPSWQPLPRFAVP
jgi:hypothetical protein